MFPLQPIPYFCTTGFASLRFHRTCPRLHSHPYLELNPWAFGSLPPDQALAVSPGTASNLQRGWNDSNQKTPNKTTTLINSLSFPHGNQSMLPEQLCPDTARVQLTPSMMFGCSRLCPRAKPSFRDQAETLSASPDEPVRQISLPSASPPELSISRQSAPQPNGSGTHMAPSYRRRQSSGTGDALLKHVVTCC